MQDADGEYTEWTTFWPRDSILRRDRPSGEVEIKFLRRGKELRVRPGEEVMIFPSPEACDLALELLKAGFPAGLTWAYPGSSDPEGWTRSRLEEPRGRLPRTT